LFYCLDCIQIETWKETIKENKDMLIHDVDYGDIDSNLGRVEKVVEENRHTGGGNLLMNILEKREIYFGKLQRVGTNFVSC
jgi:hypothetical protein